MDGLRSQYKPRFALYLLGPPRIELDGVEVHIGRRKAVALLVYLVVEGRSHSRDALAALLWPEYDQSSARADLRRTLSLLNGALGEGWLTADRETAGLDPDADLWLDVDVFRGLLAECEGHGHAATEVCPECVPLLEAAVALYRDDFLAGFTLPDSLAFDEWQFFQTQGLRDDLAVALERLVCYHSDVGEYDAAIAYARRRLTLDQTHEPAHCQLMELYSRVGQVSAALRQYRVCMRSLEEELGVPPSAETTALYERLRGARLVREEKEALAPPPPVPSTPLPPAFLSAEAAPLQVEKPVFVARERELACLEGYLEAALAGQGQVAFVTGGPGRGKTALMGEFARRAMDAYVDPGLLVAHGTCNAYSGIGDPYLPFREVLGMLTGDVETRWAAGAISRDHTHRLWSAFPLAAQALVDHGPSLIGTLLPGRGLLSRALAVAPEGAGWLRELRALSERERSSHSSLEQSALFEQVANVLGALATHHPLLLLLDDMQWADSGSVSLLFHLGRRLADVGGRILIACAYRPEEVTLGRDGKPHPLGKALVEFRRSFGDVWLDLRWADEMEGRSFVDAFLDTEPNRLGEDFCDELFRHTGGHPLFTIELLRAMQERGDLVQDAEGRWAEGPALEWEMLPARVEAVIEARVGRLDEELRDLLAVASVEGERFTAQVVADVQELSERDVLRALSRELADRHRLVEEGEEVQIDGRFLSRYRFVHALFQEYLYRALSGGERRLLHGEVAVALEGLYGDRTTEILAGLAHHYDAAGDRGKAIEYLVRAGEQARLAYANEEAVGHYQRALALLGPRSGPPVRDETDVWRLEALRGLGLIYFRTGRPEEAEARLQEALALGKEIGLAPRELVRLYHWLGEVMLWLNRFDEQVRISEEGLALLDDAAASGEAVESVEVALMNQAVAAGYWGRDYKRARELTYRTAEFLQRLDYCEELQVAYCHVMIWHIVDKHVEQAMKWSQALEERAAARHHLTGVAQAHYWAGAALGLRGDIRGALSKHRQAAELYTKIGDTGGGGGARLCLANDCLALGKLQEAEEYARRGLEMKETAGHTHEHPWGHWLVGQICLCQRDWAGALDALRRAAQLCDGDPKEPGIVHTLGRAHLAQGDKAQALRRFEEAIALPPREGGWPDRPPAALSGLEQAHEDPDAFRAFCRRLQEEQPRSSFFPRAQWFLEPAEPHAFRQESVHDDFVGSLSPAWVWSDPFGDCSYAARNGLEVRAANERDLWYANLSAPRVLRPASTKTDWAAQTVCGPISREQPAMGGILLWQDEKNYLRLDRGVAGEHEISFTGCLGNEDAIIGRGRLVVGDSGRVFLRLERVGERVRALCSVEGVEWFTVGEVEVPLEDPIQVGLHAIGWIDRTVYHGAYPDGTAIRFESFRLWGLDR